MINRSTNINKTNHHLSSELTEHEKVTTYHIWNPGLYLGRVQKWFGIKPINDIPILPSW
jgi:hypothetical protein